MRQILLFVWVPLFKSAFVNIPVASSGAVRASGEGYVDQIKNSPQYSYRPTARDHEADRFRQADKDEDDKDLDQEGSTDERDADSQDHDFDDQARNSNGESQDSELAVPPHEDPRDSGQYLPHWEENRDFELPIPNNNEHPRFKQPAAHADLHQKSKQPVPYNNKDVREPAPFDSHRDIKQPAPSNSHHKGSENSVPYNAYPKNFENPVPYQNEHENGNPSLPYKEFHGIKQLQPHQEIHRDGQLPSPYRDNHQRFGEPVPYNDMQRDIETPAPDNSERTRDTPEERGQRPSNANQGRHGFPNLKMVKQQPRRKIITPKAPLGVGAPQVVPARRPQLAGAPITEANIEDVMFVTGPSDGRVYIPEHNNLAKIDYETRRISDLDWEQRERLYELLDNAEHQEEAEYHDEAEFQEESDSFVVDESAFAIIAPRRFSYGAEVADCACAMEKISDSTEYEQMIVQCETCYISLDCDLGVSMRGRAFKEVIGDALENHTSCSEGGCRLFTADIEVGPYILIYIGRALTQRMLSFFGWDGRDNDD